MLPPPRTTVVVAMAWTPTAVLQSSYPVVEARETLRVFKPSVPNILFINLLVELVAVVVPLLSTMVQTEARPERFTKEEVASQVVLVYMFTLFGV
jgi:hypothetical protein